MATRSLVLIALLAASLASGCSASDVSQTDSGDQFVNDGAPISPTANRDWYELISRETSLGVTVEEFGADDSYARLTRPDMTPNWIVPVAQALADKPIVMGYTLRYDDRIALLITPEERPMDAAAEVKERVTSPDVHGKTRLYHRTSVRGFDGVQRSATVQKWKSGEEIKGAALIEWQEPSDGPAPYIRYTLMGDVPVGQLHAIAAQLR